MKPLGWKSLVGRWPQVAIAVLIFLTAALIIPWLDWDKVFAAIEQFHRRPEKVVEVRPTVLLVSSREQDRFIVGNTVEPRGYLLRVVETAKAGQEVLDQERDQVSVVVFDQAIPGASSLIRASRAVSPRARVVELHGQRDTTQVSALLVNWILN